MKQFKTSFLLHDDSLEILNEVSDEEAGKLLKAIAKAHKAILSEKTEWVNSDNLGLNRLEWVLFKPFYNQLLRDYEAYQITVEVNRENGKKGGRPRKEEPKKPNGLKNNPNNPDTIRYDTIREDSDTIREDSDTIREDSDTIREDKDTKPKGKEQEEEPSDEIEVVEDWEIHFDLFWKHYPKKKSKAQAEKAFVKALKIIDIDTILVSLENHKRTNDWQKQNGQFIPYPASWLNARGWENELELAEVGISSGMQEYLHLLNQRGEI